MATIILIYAIASFISLLVITALIKNAPEGWEDEDGFHKGKQIESKENIKHVS